MATDETDIEKADKETLERVPFSVYFYGMLASILVLVIQPKLGSELFCTVVVMLLGDIVATYRSCKGDDITVLTVILTIAAVTIGNLFLGPLMLRWLCM